MADGQVQTIELQGITRNLTKINVQDGQAEDLLNLRFVDGAWRASGNGRLIDFSMGVEYKNVFIHTNIYHHLLGVDPSDNTLYWFGEIAADGVTFAAIETRKPIVVLTGNIISIEQMGNLITIIDDADTYVYSLFMRQDGEYKVINSDANGEQNSRGIFPYGGVHLNMISDNSSDYVYSEKDADQYIILDAADINQTNSTACIPKLSNGEVTDETMSDAASIWHAQMLSVFKKATEANRFTRPFLAMIAVKLYDGKYAFASNPVLLNPREKYAMDRNLTFMHNGKRIGTQVSMTPNILDPSVADDYYYPVEDSLLVYGTGANHNEWAKTTKIPVYTSGASTHAIYSGSLSDNSHSKPDAEFCNEMESRVRGADILLNIDDISMILDNPDVFTGIGIFVTRQADVFDMSANGYKKGKVILKSLTQQPIQVDDPLKAKKTSTGNATYSPYRRTTAEIVHDLVNSPFFLLREYSINELPVLQQTHVVSLTDPKYKGLLDNITNADMLNSEALERKTYKPKVVYSYNQKLHIANYDATQFHGYPIDLFHLNNHLLDAVDGQTYKGVLTGLTDKLDSYQQQLDNTSTQTMDDLQHARQDTTLLSDQTLQEAQAPCLIVRVHIKTSQGEQLVSRYIEANTSQSAFVEDLSPMLFYPDARAKKMEIYYISGITHGVGQIPSTYYMKRRVFELTAHPYINAAYYANIEDDMLKPIPLSSFDVWPEPVGGAISIASLTQMLALKREEFSKEEFPNGLKVSAITNPFFFPYETTYQIGSSEIRALCSNAIAVGTGQTGAAPLYVFCADGIYALFVDQSGEMTYTNARIIARDVLNNAKSVTPMDAGVAFTTDRGLMMIAGEQVHEVGKPAEGDVLRFFDSASPEYIERAHGALVRVAELPASICDTTDFLTYLTGAILNYNHNERELMVSNPSKSYSYVMDSEGKWSRRDYTADEYVNNYPTSYRLMDGSFYKVDEEGGDGTPLEQRKEADNKFFYLSQVIKLGSVGYKEAHRFVVRGYFESKVQHTTRPERNIPMTIGCYVFGSYDGRKWKRLGGRERRGKFTNIGCTVERTDMRYYRVCLAGQVTGKTRIEYMEMSCVPSKLNTKIR